MNTSVLNVASLERFRSGYEPRLLWAGATTTVVVTALSLGINRIIAGAWWTQDDASFFAFCIVGLAAVALPWLTARQAGDSAQVPRVYWLQSGVQLQWLFFMAWGAHPVVQVCVPILFLVALVNDTRYFYAAWNVIQSYASALPIFVCVLLLISVLGDEGVLAELQDRPHVTMRFFVVAAITTATGLFFLRIIGGQWQRLDEQALEREHLQRALDVERAEAEVVRQVSSFVTLGLSAGRFTHDVASPLSTLNLCLRRLERQAEGDESLILMRSAVERLVAQQRLLAAAIRRAPTPTSRCVGAVVDDAIALARLTGAKLAGVEGFIVERVVEDMNVMVTEQHIGAIADIVSNAARQSSERIELRGQAKDDELYEVSVRDFGTDGLEQRKAAARADAAARSTAGEQTEAGGQGIGLAIARLTALRFGGRLEIEPAEGTGLRVTLTLPLDLR